MHLPQLIVDLTIILGAAGVVSLVFRRLQLPVVLGYLLSGFFVGPHFPYFFTVTDISNIRAWGEVGIIFLLFGLGLEFSYKKLLRLGGASLLVGIVEIGFVMSLGILAADLLGWSAMDRLFLGGCLAISSTAIILHSFEELGLHGRRFAGIVLGVLIVEDLVAVLLLVLLTTISVSRQFEGSQLALQLFQLGIYFIAWYLVGIFILPPLLARLKRWVQDETALIVGAGLCLAMSWLASVVGFSPALGAFLTGSIAAETVWSSSLERLFKPLRTLFGAVFFVSVGMLVEPQLLIENLHLILMVALVLVFGKFFGVTVGVLATGRSLRHAVQSGVSMAQIGEFSFIIVGLGSNLKVISSNLYPITLGVAILTTALTPALMRWGDPFAEYLQKALPQSLSDGLSRYQGALRGALTLPNWTQWLKAILLRVLFNGVVVIIIFLLAKKWGVILPEPLWAKEYLPHFTPLVLALAGALPFLWAMAFSQPDPAKSSVTLNRKQGGLIFTTVQFARLVFAFMLFLYIATEFFSLQEAILFGLVLLAATWLFIAKSLEDFYRRIENQFLESFKSSGSSTSDDGKARIAPWDARIAEVVLPAESSLVGQSLVKLNFREKYGLTVTLIKRGALALRAPNKDEILMPGDQLFLLGVDEDLDRFQRVLTTTAIQSGEESTTDFDLVPILLTAGSPFLNQPIRESGIREKTKGLIVGIERKGQRWLNPESSMKLESGDLVWLVGDRSLIQKLNL